MTVSGHAAARDVAFVDRLSEKTGLTRSFYVARAVREFVERQRARPRAAR